MPYTIRKTGSGGKPYCVHKVSDGKRMGCHESRAGAARQIAAIEASESKEMKTIALDPHMLTAVVEKEVPPSVISFEELDEAERSEAVAQVALEAANSFSQMVQNIILNDGIDRETALNRLVREFLQRIEGVSRVQYGMAKEIEEESHDKAAIKREGGIDFPARDFAFVPDPSKPSTWKLRLTESPGKVTRAQLARAAAALSPGGFRGNRVQLPASVVSAVKRRIRAEYRKLGVSPQEIPNSVKEATDGSDFMVWKGNDGRYRWLAIYSNNFRDQDRIPEIISEKSHRTYEYLVDNGIVDYPEVWLWHTPGTAWGKADMITYSDGFAIAGGHVYEGKEHIAEALAKSAESGSDHAVSHGMPAKWILRNEDDPTIIDFHITNEISPLPRYAAANKMTGFVVFSSKDAGDESMTIPANKKQWLVDDAGLSPEWVERLESGLAKQRQSATDAGVESKEVDAVAELEAVEEAVTEEEAIEEMPKVAPVQVTQEQSPELVEAQKPAMQEESPELTAAKEETEVVAEEEPAPVEEVKQVDNPLTREELADVFAAIIKSNEESVSSLESRIKELEVEVRLLKKTDTEKIATLKEETPPDSLFSMISSRIIGEDNARVDGRTALAKEGPQETEAKSRDYTGSPFLNKLMDGSQATVEQ